MKGKEEVNEGWDWEGLRRNGQEEATFHEEKKYASPLCQTPGVSLIAFLCSPGFPDGEKKDEAEWEGRNGTMRREQFIILLEEVHGTAAVH